MRFAYCPETGDRPAEVQAQVRVPATGPDGQPETRSIWVVLDGEGKPLRCLDGEDLTTEIAFELRRGADPEIRTPDGRACEWRWQFSGEINQNGERLLNMEKVASFLPNHSRYNKGWVKSVGSIDRSVTNGHSLKGDFFPDRAVWCAPGLYLDCSIAGSRNRPSKCYQLFRLYPDGTMALIDTTGDSRSWATNLWPTITEQLAEIAAGDLPAEPAEPKIEPAAVLAIDVAEAIEPEAVTVAEADPWQPPDEAANEDDRINRAVLEFARCLALIRCDSERQAILDLVGELAATNSCPGCMGAGMVSEDGQPDQTCEYCAGEGLLVPLAQLEAAAAA